MNVSDLILLRFATSFFFLLLLLQKVMNILISTTDHSKSFSSMGPNVSTLAVNGGDVTRSDISQDPETDALPALLEDTIPTARPVTDNPHRPRNNIYASSNRVPSGSDHRTSTPTYHAVINDIHLHETRREDARLGQAPQTTSARIMSLNDNRASWASTQIPSIQEEAGDTRTTSPPHPDEDNDQHQSARNNDPPTSSPRPPKPRSVRSTLARRIFPFKVLCILIAINTTSTILSASVLITSAFSLWSRSGRIGILIWFCLSMTFAIMGFLLLLVEHPRCTDIPNHTRSLRARRGTEDLGQEDERQEEQERQVEDEMPESERTVRRYHLSWTPHPSLTRFGSESSRGSSSRARGRGNGGTIGSQYRVNRPSGTSDPRQSFVESRPPSGTTLHPGFEHRELSATVPLPNTSVSRAVSGSSADHRRLRHAPLSISHDGPHVSFLAEQERKQKSNHDLDTGDARQISSNTPAAISNPSAPAGMLRSGFGTRRPTLQTSETIVHRGPRGLPLRITVPKVVLGVSAVAARSSSSGTFRPGGSPEGDGTGNPCLIPSPQLDATSATGINKPLPPSPVNESPVCNYPYSLFPTQNPSDSNKPDQSSSQPWHHINPNDPRPAKTTTPHREVTPATVLEFERHLRHSGALELQRYLNSTPVSPPPFSSNSPVSASSALSFSRSVSVETVIRRGIYEHGEVDGDEDDVMREGGWTGLTDMNEGAARTASAMSLTRPLRRAKSYVVFSPGGTAGTASTADTASTAATVTAADDLNNLPSQRARSGKEVTQGQPDDATVTSPPKLRRIKTAVRRDTPSIQGGHDHTSESGNNDNGQSDCGDRVTTERQEHLSPLLPSHRLLLRHAQAPQSGLDDSDQSPFGFSATAEIPRPLGLGIPNMKLSATRRGVQVQGLNLGNEGERGGKIILQNSTGTREGMGDDKSGGVGGKWLRKGENAGEGKPDGKENVPPSALSAVSMSSVWKI